MGLFQKIEDGAKKMKWYDFSILKLSVLFFTLFLVTAWSDFNSLVMSVEWYWHLAIGILLAIPLWKKVFF